MSEAGLLGPKAIAETYLYEDLPAPCSSMEGTGGGAVWAAIPWARTPWSTDLLCVFCGAMGVFVGLGALDLRSLLLASPGLLGEEERNLILKGESIS